MRVLLLKYNKLVFVLVKTATYLDHQPPALRSLVLADDD